MSKIIKEIWNAITTVLVAIVVFLAALIWGPRLLGMNVFVVQSGSMEPAYPVGSLVYVKEADAKNLEVGDVITFDLDVDVRGTHRIIEITGEGDTLAFQTKGDANDDPDGNPVEPSDIIGKVVFSIPYLGFLTAYIQQSSGKYVVISVVAVLLLLIILPDILFDEKKKQEDTQ